MSVGACTGRPRHKHPSHRCGSHAGRGTTAPPSAGRSRLQPSPASPGPAARSPAPEGKATRAAQPRRGPLARKPSIHRHLLAGSHQHVSPAQAPAKVPPSLSGRRGPSIPYTCDLQLFSIPCFLHFQIPCVHCQLYFILKHVSLFFFHSFSFLGEGFLFLFSFLYFPDTHLYSYYI